MVDASQLNDDPFFRLTDNSAWNACIGKQGTEENYLDGYIEAAIELVTTVIDKKMFDKRDTIVLPVLYNARHAIELVLKYVVNRLAEEGLVQPPSKPHHDIQRYLKLVEGSEIGDENLRNCLATLKPFVTSLSRIDEDGQELRYHTNRNDDPSMSDFSLANLEVIRDSLKVLSKAISELKYRTIDFIDDRAIGAHTSRLSRRDLIAIVKSLPPHDQWRDSVFDEKRKEIQARFHLSGKQFSDAVDVIKSNRQMKALIGVETSLIYLPDHVVIFVAEQWRRLHPKKEAAETGIVSGANISLQEMIEHTALEGNIVSTIQKRLTAPQMAELETICSLGRHGWLSELYEQRVEKTMVRHNLEAAPDKQATDLIDKTTFLNALVKALRQLGRGSLADRLCAM